MNELNIICCINNGLYLNDFTVNIYDKDTNLLDTKKTENNQIKITTEEQIIILEVLPDRFNLSPYKIVKKFNINDMKEGKIYFNFIDLLNIKIPITIEIVDQNYPDLKIEKGTLYL